MNRLKWLTAALLWFALAHASAHADESLRQKAMDTMAKATRYFRSEVATNGGYLWQYKSDLTLREGEERAWDTTIWVQPPGTPAVGIVFLNAYEATGDTLYLNGAINAARALVWGQLASGGWDYRVEFDPERNRSRRYHYHYRRDVEAGDTDTGERRNTTTLDDNNTQSALRLLMRVDKRLDFKNKDIHNAVTYGLNALLKAQYPNGAWPQRYAEFPDPEKYPVKKAHYPDTWSREFPKKRYQEYYTFNDNAMADVIEVMIEAYKTYDDVRYFDAAKRGGDFMILAQMPDPQPAWAQQYNLDMEPAWARKFEPPSITGGETFGIMRTLMDLYLETGEKRFLEPIPKALAWAKRSRLPDGRMARFYELKTNTPLYFTLDYVLTYDDSDMPTHYAFKVGGNGIERTEAYYNRLKTEDRNTLLAERNNRTPNADPERIQEIIASLDDQGRWTQPGQMLSPENRRERIDAEVISCRTFNRNLTMLTRYLKASQ